MIEKAQNAHEGSVTGRAQRARRRNFDGSSWALNVARQARAFGKNQLSEPLRTLVSALQFMLSTDSPRFHPHLLRLRLQSPRAHWGS
jgi:hypothetical protein